MIENSIYGKNITESQCMAHGITQMLKQYTISNLASQKYEHNFNLCHNDFPNNYIGINKTYKLIWISSVFFLYPAYYGVYGILGLIRRPRFDIIGFGLFEEL